MQKIKISKKFKNLSLDIWQRIYHAKNQPSRLKTVAYSLWKNEYDLHRKPEVVFKLDKKREEKSVEFNLKTIYTKFHVSRLFGSILQPL